MSTENNYYITSKLERLLEALDSVGLGARGRVTKIADFTRYSKNQVSWMLSGKTPLNDRFVNAVCTKCHISERWLDTGEPPMFDSSNAKSDVKLIPVHSTVPAGWPADNYVAEEPIGYVPYEGNGRSKAALLVEGDSMYPEIKNGEYVLYVEDYDFKPGDWVIALNEFNKPMVKEYAIKDGEPWLISLNSSYGNHKINDQYTMVGRVVEVFRYAIQSGYCSNDPTYALKGALKAQRRTHYATVIDPAAVGALLSTIEGYHGGVVVKNALRLLPLVFLRPGELRQARWAEFDLDAGIWNVPAERMKMKRPHAVPLSRQAVAILRELEAVSGGMKYVFPTSRTGRCISEMAMNTALRSMGIGKEKITGHGFRAMARTLLDEQLHYRVDYIEHQLAHAVKDPLGRAYNRTTHLKERTEMMQAWSDYLDRLKLST